MKKIQRITKVHLKIGKEEKCLLIGVVSAEPDYKLSLAINRKFGISLKSISPVNITSDTGPEFSFSRFSDSNGSKETIFTLVSNRFGKNFLIKKLKNIDYLFLIYNTEDESENDILPVTSKLREIESVNAVFNIDVNSLRDKILHYLIS
jgi:hypothetical protein